MNDSLKLRILKAFLELPNDCRGRTATERELASFESDYEPIPAEYRWFLQTCGGGTVGSEWVDDIDELPQTHRKFREESSQGNGWTMRGVFVIGWDGWGNPFGINTSTGQLLVEDHNFGGVHAMKESFAAFLEDGLFK